MKKGLLIENKNKTEGKTKWPSCYLIITENHSKIVKKNTQHNYLIKIHKLNLNKRKTYTLCTSLRLLSGSNISKSTLWVTVWTLPISDSFNFVDPFDFQNEWITLLSPSFLHFNRVYVMFKDYHLCRLVLSLQLFLLDLDFIGILCLLITLEWQLQTSKFLKRTFTPISLRTFNVRSSRFLVPVVSGRPVITKHSRLAYWLCTNISVPDLSLYHKALT